MCRPACTAHALIVVTWRVCRLAPSWVTLTFVPKLSMQRLSAVLHQQCLNLNLYLISWRNAILQGIQVDECQDLESGTWLDNQMMCAAVKKTPSQLRLFLQPGAVLDMGPSVHQLHV